MGLELESTLRHYNDSQASARAMTVAAIASESTRDEDGHAPGPFNVI